MIDQIYKSISNMRYYSTKLDEMISSMKHLTDYVEGDAIDPISMNRLLKNSEDLTELYIKGLQTEFEFYKLIKKETTK